MPSPPSGAWRRLGALLVQRRIELAPRYRQRTAFAEDVGIKWRLLYDIERAKRDSFTPETLAAIEVAYRWQPGSVARVLAGGDPVPLAPPAPPGGARSPDPDGFIRPSYTDPDAETFARSLENSPELAAMLQRDVAQVVAVMQQRKRMLAAEARVADLERENAELRAALARSRHRSALRAPPCA